ncbi:MAG: DsrE/DsrF/DrsH-like family protein [Nitrososphaerales archaeon]
MPKVTIVMFSGDLDKALSAFVIATGAAAMGWDVTIVFTFWGINIVRDEKKKAIRRKDFTSKMFELMMPKGANKLRLSKMNMLGLGKAMMKKRMAAKNVQSLRQFIKDAKELGVKFIVCGLPMEIMGLQKEEFIDEVDGICTVSEYLREAKGAELNLFI